MRALIQRVSRCSVSVEGQITGSIGEGMLILLGVKVGDAEEDAAGLADRCAALRIFEDADKKMNLSVQDIAGEALVVSQFTLYADTRKGNRPGYTDAAPPDLAERLYEKFVERLRTTLAPLKVATGTFRAMMAVELVNDGPVTIMLESKAKSGAAHPGNEPLR
ncbi:MAG TPA: D-aminoacyl-tRNA deacylase [Bacteroidota bacterium]|nr:D-aminoacyl-tRNA deacylase [Bacteroidota bacterium]